MLMVINYKAQAVPQEQFVYLLVLITAKHVALVQYALTVTQGGIYRLIIVVGKLVLPELMLVATDVRRVQIPVMAAVVVVLIVLLVAAESIYITILASTLVLAPLSQMAWAVVFLVICYKIAILVQVT